MKSIDAQRALADRGLRYKDAASLTGYAPKTFEAYMSGYVRASDKFRKALADVLDVDPDALVFGARSHGVVRTTAIHGPR